MPKNYGFVVAGEAFVVAGAEPNLRPGLVPRLTWFVAPADYGAADLSWGRRAMDVSDTRERSDRANRGVGVAFDLVASKLMRPWVRPGTVHRSSLLERLANGDAHRLVSVAAPAGYGKTTLLSQWAARRRPDFCLGVGRGTGQRSEGLADLCRRSARCGRAHRRAGIRGARLCGELSARLGPPQARIGLFIDDQAGCARLGRRARAAQPRVPRCTLGTGRSCAGRLTARPGWPDRTTVAHRAAAGRGPDSGDRPRRAVAHPGRGIITGA